MTRRNWLGALLAAAAGQVVPAATKVSAAMPYIRDPLAHSHELAPTGSHDHGFESSVHTHGFGLPEFEE